MSQVVHVSRPKIVHNTDLWKRKQHRNATKESREKVKMHLDEDEGDEFRIGPLPMQILNYADRTVFETPLLSTPDPVQQMVETPLFERNDHNNSSPRTPRSRRGIQPTRTEPLLQGRERE
jgi:hypothetical protein